MSEQDRYHVALKDQADLYTALHGLAGAGDHTPDLTTILSVVDAVIAARLRAVDAGLLDAILRHGATGIAVPQAATILDYLGHTTPAPVFLPKIEDSRSISLPTSGQRPDMPAFSDHAFDNWFSGQAVDYGLGLYGEDRTVYQTDQFADAASPERRTVHLGIDVFAPAGTSVHAPLAGQVAYLTYNADPLDYGHTLILQHEAEGVPFFTLYGHLGGSLPNLLKVGDAVKAGQLIAHLGDWHENGGWAAHLHFQIMTTMLEQREGNFFGVGHASLWPVWREICPDPNLILRLPGDRFEL